MAGEITKPTQQPEALRPEILEAGLVQTEAFLTDIAPHLGRLFGMDIDIRIGKGWATDLKSGQVTADPNFFLEKGYTPDMASYAVLHETAAHLREVVTEPRLTDKVIQFCEQGKPQSIFHNILADVAGNNLIHAVLPRMRGVAEELYKEKLFPDDLRLDEETEQVKTYAEIPRHLQFLYKIIREEMIPGSHTDVLPEVQTALDGLRDYQGQGDLIVYSTSVAKSSREAMNPSERFAIWTSIIYPLYDKLLQQDRQDPNFQGRGDSQDGGEPQEGEPGEEQSDKDSQGDEAGDSKQFGEYYQDYDENKHPEPMSDEDQEKVHERAKQNDKNSRKPPVDNHERMMDEKLRAETGHGLREQRQYDAEILKWQSSIEEMRQVYQQIISERVAVRRGLSRRTMPEGAILDPDRLSQVVIDGKAGANEPDVFRDYEAKKGTSETVGKTDYIFLFDVSGSMNFYGGEKARAAASSAVIGLEGLAAMQRDIEAAEATHHTDLDLDIRTAIYTFGEDSTCVKPLSPHVRPKERLDTYAAILGANDGRTNDFMGLEEIGRLPVESDRRQIVIAVSDGESDNPGKARRAIDSLRGAGWFVYGISIGSDEAENLYRPTAKRIDDPALLPKTIAGFIESTIS